VTLVNLVDAMPSSQRRDAGADCSVLVNRILSAGDSVYLPRRAPMRGGATPPFRMSEVIARSDTAIVCESPGVFVTTARRGEPIFTTGDETVSGFVVRAGTWGGRSNGDREGAVFAQERGRLSRAFFERMIVTEMQAGFFVTAADACVWRDCAFKSLGLDRAGSGLHLAPRAGERMRSNTVVNCKFEDVGDAGVWLDGRGATSRDGVGPIVATRIEDCWFQNQREPGVAALRVDGGTDGLLVERCYFEKVCDGDDVEILLDASDGGEKAIRGVVIRANLFARPWNRVGQRWRLRSIGAASFVAADNDVQTRTHSTPARHARFARCEERPEEGSPVWLKRNLIHWHDDSGGDAVAPASIEDATYECVQQQESLEFEGHPGCVGIMGRRHRRGRSTPRDD